MWFCERLYLTGFSCIKPFDKKRLGSIQGSQSSLTCLLPGGLAELSLYIWILAP